MSIYYNSVQLVASSTLATDWGQFRIFGFERDFDQGGWRRRESAVALAMGDIKSAPPLLRIHSQCLTGDVFRSLRCDCGRQLSLAFETIAKAGSGLVIYEEQEGRGIGIMAKIMAYELQDFGCDTVEANERLGFKSDYRNFILPIEILRHFGIAAVRLLSNNPEKASALEEGGIKVVERVSCEVDAGPAAEEYLRTKQRKLGHALMIGNPNEAMHGHDPLGSRSSGDGALRERKKSGEDEACSLE